MFTDKGADGQTDGWTVLCHNTTFFFSKWSYKNMLLHYLTFFSKAECLSAVADVGHLTTMLTKTKPTNYVKSYKIYFSILQDLLINPENKMVTFSYKN